MQVRTDHRIVVVGGDLQLRDFATDEVIVTAQKSAGGWAVTAGEHVSVVGPEQVVQAMVDTALEVLPGTGYSCWVPSNLDTPVA
jgi:hypothetical protein